MVEHLELLSVEKNRLDKVSQPLRQYLADNIIPVLTQGLIEIATKMPSNPVEHLANYLEEHQNDIDIEEELSSQFVDVDNN